MQTPNSSNLFSQLTGNFSQKAVRSFAVQGIGIALNFALAIVLAQHLGAEHYGILVWAFSWTSVLSVIAIAGSDDLLIKWVAAGESGGQVRAVVKWAFKRSFTGSIFIAIAGFSLVQVMDLGSLENVAIQLALFSVPLMTIGMLYQSALKGKEKVALGQYPEKWIRPIVLLLIVVLGIEWVSQGALQQLLYAQLAALLLAAGLSWWHWVGHQPTTNESAIPQSKVWRKSALFFWMATMVGMLNMRADILMLGWDFLNPDKAQVGIYNVAARLSDFVAFSLAVTTPIIWPRVAKLLGDKEFWQVQKLVRVMARLNTLFGVVVGLLLAFFASEIFAIFGKSFTLGTSLIGWIIAGKIVTLFFGPAGAVLSMGGFERHALYAGIVGLGVNLVLNFWLIPIKGAEGAAIATGISFALWNGLQTLWAYKKTGVSTLAIGFSR